VIFVTDFLSSSESESSGRRRHFSTFLKTFLKRQLEDRAACGAEGFSASGFSSDERRADVDPERLNFRTLRTRTRLGDRVYPKFRVIVEAASSTSERTTARATGSASKGWNPINYNRKCRAAVALKCRLAH